MGTPIPIRRKVPLSPEGFKARLTRCRAELAPVLDRFSRRHGVEILFAALLAEVEEGTVELHAGSRLSSSALADVIARLQAIEADRER